MEQRNITIQKQKYSVGVRDEVDDSVLAEIFKVREYRIAEEVMQNAANAIIDVGAHAGFFTLYARAFNQTVPIFAIEPEAGNIRAFKQNIQTNHIDKVVLVEGVLAQATGIRKLSVSSDSHTHSLAPENTSASDRILTVKAYSLRDLLETRHLAAVDLVKLDIEGGEFEVFESLDENTFTKINAVILEYHNSKGKAVANLEKVLREHGFSVQVFPSKFDKTMGFLFANNKRQRKNSR